MAETLSLPATSNRSVIYEILVPQIAALVEGETDLIANLANIVAALRQGFDFFWIGFYLKKDNHLVLGPFQGPIACTRINFDKGVCGACYSRREIIIVPDDILRNYISQQEIDALRKSNVGIYSITVYAEKPAAQNKESKACCGTKCCN